MKYFFVFIISAFLLLPFTSHAANETCSWMKVREGLYCSTEKGNPDWLSVAPARCGQNGVLAQGYQCCCGPVIEPVKKVTTKSIIIFSLVAFFAILTLSILIYRKNDQT